LTKEETTTLGCIAQVLFIPIAVAISGWTTMYLWNGLISSTFGLITLNFWQAAGLDVFISYMISDGGKDGRSTIEAIVGALAKTLIMLFIGWIIIQNI